MRRWQKQGLLLLATLLPVAQSEAAGTIRLATLAYPPFCDQEQPDGGALVAITRAAFARQGIRMQLTVLPWPRLVSQLAQDRFDGVIGVWNTDLAAMRLRGGSPVFHSLVGVYLLRQSSLDIGKPGALHGKLAGIVHGYNYSDSIMRSGLKFEFARDDETNLRKLQLGRIDVAIVEKAVGDSLLATQRLRQGRLLRWGGTVLAVEPLAVGFASGSGQDYWHAQFESGLQKLKQDGQYLRMVQAAGLSQYLPH
ncbi:polar amino acid transport system substrate-binding protein [Vogesella perlucida]|nr:polar amino acid transport system substrate-binding protein [Vogesella perlucida]